MNIWKFFESSIQRKLLLSFILVVLVFGVIVLPIAYYGASDALTTESIEAVSALATTRESQFTQWIDDLRVNLLALSHNEAVVTASRAFRNTIDTSQELGLTNETRLASLADAFVGQPELTDAIDLSSPYRAVHQRFHSFFRDTQLVYGYSDVILTNIAGDIIYSSNKNPDVFTNLANGEYSDSGLGDAVQQVLRAGANEEREFIVFVDFSIYPATGEPTAFIASSIYGDQEFLGALVYAIPISLIEEILNFRVGFGETGESYVIGSDNLPRSNIELDGIEGNVVLNPEAHISTEAVNAALNGEQSVGFTRNYRGVDVLSAWQPIVLELPNSYGSDGVIWALVSEITVAEAISPANQLILLMGLGLLAGTGVVLVLSFVISRQISGPIIQLTKSVEKVSERDFDLNLEIRGQDEMGLLGKAFVLMSKEINGLIGNLEHRVAERTRDLEVAAAVSREVSNELDLNALLPSIAERTRTGFGLYHVSVYLFDPETQLLVYTSGTGEAGQRMGDNRWTFHLNDRFGLVPQAARSKQAILVNDVTLSDVHFVNQWLPDTRSELALAMMFRDELIGVLDLQSTEINAFSEEDLRVLTSLVQQLAIAIQNARLYAEQVEVSEQLRNVDRMKSEFLARMSHELRTPLNSIINFTKFVIRGYYDDDPETKEKMLTDVVKSAEHLLDMINDILDMSKIESGTMQLFIEEVRIQDAIDAAVSMGDSEIKARDKTIEILLDVPSDLPSIFADKRCLKQVLINFVTNAVKFTDDGTVKIVVKTVDDMVFISVTDTGCGIPSDQLDLVFRPFEQTEEGKSQGTGTGLGLPISKRLVEAHHGKILVESVVGQGSTFTAIFPIRDSELELALIESRGVAV
jgi:signal transduction histidine kinase/HAMP domain-containing protein